VDWNSDVSTDFERSYIVGVAAEVELFDGFRRDAAVSGASAQQRAAAAEAEKASNNLRLDLTYASIQAGEAWDRLDVARKSIENAEEALRITGQRYQQGAADLPELLTAQVGLTGTRSRNVAALYDYWIALSNLERAKGELVQRYERRGDAETGRRGEDGKMGRQGDKETGRWGDKETGRWGDKETGRVGDEQHSII
jgi:outer membrane protein TolC